MTSIRSFRSILATSAALALVSLLGACATSPDSHYYTLITPGIKDSSSPDTAKVGGSPLLFELLPVNVPNQVSRPQIVLTESSGDVKIEDYHRWASSLEDEIGTALSQRLAHKLGAIDTYRTPRPSGSTVYRVTVNVQRFQSVRGERASIGAVWSVVRSGDSLTMTCRSAVSEPVDSSSFVALASAHRKALERISDQIAAGIRAEQAQAPVHASGAKNASGAAPVSPAVSAIACPSGMADTN